MYFCIRRLKTEYNREEEEFQKKSHHKIHPVALLELFDHGFHCDMIKLQSSSCVDNVMLVFALLMFPRAEWTFWTQGKK